MSEFAGAIAKSEESVLDDGIANLHLGSSVERPKQEKPEVQKVCGDLILPGTTSATVRAFSDDSEAQASFKECFSDVFIDPSRDEHSRTLCGKLAELADGRLEGQQNCFVGVGARGIGKSQFFTALGDWFTRIGDRDCAFLYQQMGEKDETSPFDVRTTNVRKIVHHLAVNLNWDNIPAEPWATSTECLNWLLSNNKKVFLVLDEFDQCYREENRTGLISDLAKVGGDARKRPLVIVLLGSSSRLRNLCFTKGSLEEMLSAGFAGYTRAVSLNSTKFIPLIFSPINSVDSTKHVLSSLGLKPSDTFDFAGLCKASRGEVRAFKTIFKKMMASAAQDHVSKVQRNGAWDHPSNKKILSILWQRVQRLVQDGTLFLQQLSDVMDIAVEFTPEVQILLSCSKERFIEAGIDIGQLYQCADESVISFDGDIVCFLHPADVECCISLFGNESRTDGRLTLAEEISLLNANNASTDEVNERLVCESLCEHGIVVKDLGHLKFARGSPTAPACCHGLVREKATLSIVAGDSKYDLLNQSFVGLHTLGGGQSTNAAHLRKEFPDEIGGDLIAVFRVQGAESARFIVVRVQIKLGASGTTYADDGAGTPITKMMKNEHFLVQALGVKAEQIDFVRVLWSSQRTKTTTDVAQRIIVINSVDMMNYWIEPVKIFVRERKLTAYGYQP
eukprot:gene11964-13555_t